MSSWKSLRKMEMDPLWLMRIFTIIPVLLILMAGAGSIWIYFFVLSLLPAGQTQVDMPGLKADVRVVRDSYGVPGIIGEKEQDIALVLGYVMAQDRLWQMDFLRRASQGRLAEIFGPAYLDRDHLARTIGAGIRNQEYPGSLNDGERLWVERFVQGINRYMVAHAGKLPVEFSVLEYRPEPFSPKDVMSILYALAWESSPAFKVDPVMTSLIGRLGKKRARLLLPKDPAAASDSIPAGFSGWDLKGVFFESPADGSRLLRVPGFTGGAAWSVSGNRSRSGSTMACWNIYQNLTAPRFWYRARLVGTDFNLAGAFIPGVPIALVGNGSHVSWGSVSSTVDDADLFLETVDSDSPERYWRVDRWRKIRRKNETYRVKGSSSVTRAILLTDTGPLVSDVFKGKALSLKWTAHQGLGMYQAFYNVNRAGSGSELRKALKALVAPCLNVLWADEKNNHGAQLAGKIPIRAPGSNGIVPVPAWTGVDEWIGFIPFNELPATLNPTAGEVIVADGRPGGMHYPFFVSCYWNDASRSDRIKELLDKETEHQKESFHRIQMDDLSPIARQLSPVLSKSVQAKGGWSESEREAARILGSWDFTMDTDSAGAAIFGLAYQAILEDSFLKAMGRRLYDGFTGYPPLAARMVRRMFLEQHPDWLGNAKPDDILRNSFTNAVARGVDLLGKDPAKWQWGQIHRTVLRHPLTERSRFLELVYHVGPVPLPGSNDTVNAAGWSKAHPFHVNEGVSLRQLAVMTGPPTVFGVSPMGSSAHFFSVHYKDQMGAWVKGKSFRDPVQRSDIRKHGFNAVRFKSRRIKTISRR